MTDWSPAAVESAIYECAQRIARGVLICDKAYREFLEADHAFDLVSAQHYVESAGPAHQRKFEVTLRTSQERRRRDEAEAAYRLAERNMRAVQAELEALRSIGTSVRQAYAVAGRGEEVPGGWR